MPSNKPDLMRFLLRDEIRDFPEKLIIKGMNEIEWCNHILKLGAVMNEIEWE